MIERSTYSLLDWFGDLGGLYEALYFLGYFVASPAAAMSLKANLLEKNFLFVRSKEYENDKEGRKDLPGASTILKNTNPLEKPDPDSNQMLGDFTQAKSIPRFYCFCARRKK